ncbi:hypothetical protein [Streptomyces sp. NPDC005148]
MLLRLVQEVPELYAQRLQDLRPVRLTERLECRCVDVRPVQRGKAAPDRVSTRRAGVRRLCALFDVGRPCAALQVLRNRLVGDTLRLRLRGLNCGERAKEFVDVRRW